MYHELVNYATPKYPFLTEHLNVRYIHKFTLHAADICIIPQGLVHNLYTHTYSKCLVIKLYPLVDLSNIYLTQYVLSKGSKGYDRLMENMNNIIREDQRKEPGYELAVNICAEIILLTILRELEHQKINSKIKTKHLSEHHFLSSVNDFLELNYTHDISLGDISDYFNYTKSYFCRHFKKITKLSFSAGKINTADKNNTAGKFHCDRIEIRL